MINLVLKVKVELVTLYQMTLLDLSELIAFTDKNLNASPKFKFALGRVENMVGKGENAGYIVEKDCEKRRKCWLPAFYPFPTMFSKDLHTRVVKSHDCVVKSMASVYNIPVSLIMVQPPISMHSCRWLPSPYTSAMG